MDKYDRAVESLLAKLPHDPYAAWKAWQSNRARADDPEGCLFQYVTPDGLEAARQDGEKCGCLTQIRIGNRGAWLHELTCAIHNDTRLPTSVVDTRLTRAQLEACAEWQRRLDKEIRGRGVESEPQPDVVVG